MKKNPQDKAVESTEHKKPDLDLEQYDLAMGGSDVDETSPATEADKPNIKRLIEDRQTRKTIVKRGFNERGDGTISFDK